MKTTLDLPDELMRAAKIHAAQHNQRLKDVVADALRAALELPGMDERRVVGNAESAHSRMTTRTPGADATVSAAQRRQRFDALLAQLDRVPDRPDAADPLAWDDLGLPR